MEALPRTRRAPSPACGGGLGRGQIRNAVPLCPLPIPPPQAGEGTLEASHRTDRASLVLDGPCIAVGPQRLPPERYRRRRARRMTRRGAELQRFEALAEQLDAVHSLRPVVAALDHAGLERVRAVGLAERDVFGPQRDAHLVARRQRLKQRAFGALAVAELHR